MTIRSDHLPKRNEPGRAGSGIPRSQDQAMVMTQMLMRWKPRLGAFRDRRRSKTHVNVNPAASIDKTGPAVGDDEAEYEVEVERRLLLQAQAEQNLHRFVGLHQAAARALADELHLAVRFFRRGDGLTEDYCAGRVAAQMEGGVVVDARAIG